MIACEVCRYCKENKNHRDDYNERDGMCGEKEDNW
jgi:hypothetical protein